MKRTFIAVKINAGEELKNAISALRSGLREENIKWADLSNLHVTLAFIGDTEEPIIKLIVSVLETKFEGFGDIDFSLTGFGLFRNISNPRIIFSGIEMADKLIKAYEIISKELANLEIKLEERQFNPHLTIGRIKDLVDKENLLKLVSKYAGTKLQDISVSDIIYYESVLLPTGPIYKPISRIMLDSWNDEGT